MLRNSYCKPIVKKPLVMIEPGTLLSPCYLVGQRLGRGAFGEIQTALDLRTGIIWAIKTESDKAKRKTLEFEFQILAQVQSSPHFPRLGIFAQGKGFHFYSMEFLGPSLSSILKTMEDQKFSFSTSIRSIYHVLHGIEAFHTYGFIHRDIKPANVLTREGTDHPVCIIDFGLSRVYRDPETGQHIPQRKRVGFRGTKAYSSLNAHLNSDLSRRDDLISWYYMSIEFLGVTLPWRGQNDKQTIIELKRSFDIPRSTAKLGPEFTEIWRSIVRLKFTDKPNYSYIYSLLIQVMNAHGVSMDEPYDWHDTLSDYRQKVVRALNQFQEEGSSPRQTASIKVSDETGLVEPLLGPRITAPPPFSHISEDTGCCECC